MRMRAGDESRDEDEDEGELEEEEATRVFIIASSPVEETRRGEEVPALLPSRSGLPSAKRLFFFSILAKRQRTM